MTYYKSDQWLPTQHYIPPRLATTGCHTCFIAAFVIAAAAAVSWADSCSWAEVELSCRVSVCTCTAGSMKAEGGHVCQLLTCGMTVAEVLASINAAAASLVLLCIQA
jgi:hypothetical protein